MPMRAIAVSVCDLNLLDIVFRKFLVNDILNIFAL